MNVHVSNETGEVVISGLMGRETEAGLTIDLSRSEGLKLMAGLVSGLSGFTREELIRVLDPGRASFTPLIDGGFEPVGTIKDDGELDIDPVAYNKAIFKDAMNRMSQAIHQNAVDKGFWHEGQARNPGEMIALMHSELSEALEAVRSGADKSDHDHGINPVAEEMADTVIRIMDFCKGFDLNLGQAIVKKMEYNAGREHMHGGKKF